MFDIELTFFFVLKMKVCWQLLETLCEGEGGGVDPLEGPKTRRQCNLLSAQSQKGQHSYFPPTLRQKYHSYLSHLKSLKSLPAGQIKKIIKILCSFLQSYDF